MVQALITSRLDWCNSLYGITHELMRRLQSAQNAAARLITGTRRCDHISPVLRQLHWLPVRQRVSYNLQDRQSLCTLVLSGHVPYYLADDWRVTTADSSPTPASGNRDCVQPTLEHWSVVARRSHANAFDDRTSFGIDLKGGSDVEMFEILPRDWNLLPILAQKWASVDMNWGFNLPPPPGNSNSG